MGECDEKYPASVIRRDSIPKQLDEKPWEAGDAEIIAKEHFVDEGLCWKVYEER